MLLNVKLFPFHSIHNHLLASSLCSGLQLATATCLRLSAEGEVLQSQGAWEILQGNAILFTEVLVPRSALHKDNLADPHTQYMDSYFTHNGVKFKSLLTKQIRSKI